MRLNFNDAIKSILFLKQKSIKQDFQLSLQKTHFLLIITDLGG